jgi:hypothetical protein
MKFAGCPEMVWLLNVPNETPVAFPAAQGSVQLIKRAGFMVSECLIQSAG